VMMYFQMFSIAPFWIHILEKNINWCFEFYFMCYSWGKIIEHVHLIGNLSKMIRNRYLFKH
jgi:hypothetical protein